MILKCQIQVNDHSMDWHQANASTILKVIDPGVSDHSMLCLQEPAQNSKQKKYFKFQNVVIDTEDFLQEVALN